MAHPDPELQQHKPMSAEKRRDLRHLIVATMLGAACLSAQAERADRDKPVNIEADKVEIDDQKKEAVFQGNVVLTQGTLMLKADRIVVNQNEGGFQSGVAYGKPAYFRQKREGLEDFIEGEAQRLEYNGEQEKDCQKRRRQGPALQTHTHGFSVVSMQALGNAGRGDPRMLEFHSRITSAECARDAA